MKRWLIAVIAMAAIMALCAVSAFAEARVLVNTDFANSKYKVNFKNTDTKDITGKLPASWGDNSDWNDTITVSYTPTTEEGVSFLRLEKTAGGRAQLAGAVSKKTPAGTYKFTMVAKSPTGVTPEIGLRLNGEPYTFLFTTHPALTEDWATVEEEFDLDQDVKSVGIYICVDANAVLDIRSVKLEEE